ncbi:FkbM family methyltransferase [Pseudomonas sp. MAFF 302030]|uniref:FkbM family methyltransferase n=1 Tax=Pseudomonas morbosilactucae TaxID=2938197 RepID=A0A9X2CB31_9PSED|nr:FkbM family methyltransferase [Pseudomonas morbosilactucae]MCK9802119.1 FkbM family methyltransferase [Pseudomonas morbosilactucae]
MGAIKNIFGDTQAYKLMRRIYRNIKGMPRHPLQDIKNERGLNLVRLGTSYGGWNFLDDGSLKNSLIISAGLGEDASFDIEFAAKYAARVIVVDPTPRAISHFEEIKKNIGRSRSAQYVNSGTQPVEAYDLSNINKSQLTLVTKALWNKSEKLKFFSPPDHSHVSHSIINFQNNYRKDTDFIEVEAVTLSGLIRETGINSSDVSLLKLDIEGAEIEVLTQCISEGFKPSQILVEFDELNCPSKKGFARISEIHSLLTSSGYRLVCTDGNADFLYIKNK